MTRANFLSDWLPAIGWMAVIFAASTDIMSAEHTSRFIGPFLHWLNPQVSAATIARVQLIVRKGGHVTEYALLAVLLCRALRGGARKFAWSYAAVALVIASVWAASDEYHQSFVPSRTASPIDVMIDICGATIGLLVYGALARLRASRQPAAIVLTTLD